MKHLLFEFTNYKSGDLFLTRRRPEPTPSEELTLFSPTFTWGLYASRDWEIGTVGFINEDVKNIFMKSFNEHKEIFTTIESHIQDLDNMLQFRPEIKREYEKLLNNFGCI